MRPAMHCTLTAFSRVRFRPLSRAGELNLGDPFMSGMFGYPQPDDGALRRAPHRAAGSRRRAAAAQGAPMGEFASGARFAASHALFFDIAEEFEYAPAGDDDDVAAERFRAMTPGSAARTAGRSSLGAATAKGDAGAGVFDDYAALPLPADDEEEFVPMPEDDDGGGGGAPIPYDDDLFDAPAGGTQPLGDSPRPRAATPGVSGRGFPSDDDDDGHEDDDAAAEGAAPRRGGRERGAAPASFGFGPATQAAEKEAGVTKAGGGIRKRKFRVDDVIALTNAHIRAALADASDLLRPAKAQRVGAAAARAAASVDDLLAAPACLSGGACDALRGLFARAPGAAAASARALRAAAASPATAAAAATRGAAAALADVDAAPIAEEDDFGGAAGGWDDDDGYDVGGDAGMGGSAPAPEDWATAAPPPSAGRRGSAGGAARLAAALEEEGDDDARSDSEGAGGDDVAADGEGGDDAAGPADPAAWSKRTRNVLHVLQRSFAAASAAQPAAPARRGSGAAAAAAAAAEPVLALAPMLEGETKGHAARMFFELLVLHTKGYVALQQPAPYGDISIAQTPKLVAAGL